MRLGRITKTELKPMPQTDKAESWQWMISFYENLIGWQGLRFVPLLNLVKMIAASDDASTFRAGQSLDALIISTTSYHGLLQDDPHIFVQAEQTTDLFVLEYWCGHNQDNLLLKSTCKAGELMNRLSPLLKRLWHDTLGKDATQQDSMPYY